MAANKNQDEEQKFPITVFGPAHYRTQYRLDDQGIKFNDPCRVVEQTKHFCGNGYILSQLLTYLGMLVKMATPITNDTVSKLIRENSERQGIELAPIIMAGYSTASSTTIFDSTRTINLNEQRIYDDLTISILQQQIEEFGKANRLFLDSTFPEEIYTYLGWMTKQNPTVDIFILLSSFSSAKNISALLPGCKGLFGNFNEINQLAGNLDQSDKGIMKSLNILAEKGVEAAYAYGEKGVFALVKGEQIVVDAKAVEKVVSRGIGPAIAAGVVAAVIYGKSPKEAIKIGQEIAALKSQDRADAEHLKLVLQQHFEAKKSLRHIVTHTPS